MDQDRSVLKEVDWDFGHEIIDITQIPAVRSLTILKNEKKVAPMLESAADFLNVKNAHLITETLKSHTAVFENLRSSATSTQINSEDTQIFDRDTKSAKAQKLKNAADAHREAWSRVYSKIIKLQKNSEEKDTKNKGENNNVSDKYNFMRSYQMLGPEFEKLPLLKVIFQKIRIFLIFQKMSK